MSRGKETTLGRRVLDGWLFCEYSWKHGNEDMIANYVKNQGSDGKYKRLNKQKRKDHPDQLMLF